MIKKILLLALCLSWIPAMTAASTTQFDFNMIHGQTDSLHMRSITSRDKDAFRVLLEDLKKDPTNPSVGIGTVDTHVTRRQIENNSYHAMVFQVPGETLFPVVIQGRMPVFGAAAGKGYDPLEHAAIIAKWKSLGVRQTVGEGTDDAHDERVRNFGLLNFVPLIPSTLTDDARREIYTGMVDLAKALRAQGKLMPLENSHKLECTDAALPNHVVMLLDPKFRDLGLLESMGWSVDRNPEFEKFYNAPRVVVTYDLTH